MNNSFVLFPFTLHELHHSGETLLSTRFVCLLQLDACLSVSVGVKFVFGIYVCLCVYVRGGSLKITIEFVSRL